MTVKAVTNSTCLIGLERIKRLDILPQVFDTVFAPPAVAKEVQASVDWLRVQTVANPSVVTALRTQMDEGEAEAARFADRARDRFSLRIVRCLVNFG